MLRPICFMIMPYSIKSTGAPAGIGAPDKVNFDRLWDAALRPAIDGAGYEPIRANEDISALIIQEMIERLAISDLVLADVSIPNGNVYYEVGIRHAARNQGCILTAADWAKPLFDIDQMRQIRYPLPTESISDETAAEIIKIVLAAIPVMREGKRRPFTRCFRSFQNTILRVSQRSRRTSKISPVSKPTSSRRARQLERIAAHALLVSANATSPVDPSRMLSPSNSCTHYETVPTGLRRFSSSTRCPPTSKKRRW
jgi:hypothetical protein